MEDNCVHRSSRTIHAIQSKMLPIARETVPTDTRTVHTPWAHFHPNMGHLCGRVANRRPIECSDCRLLPMLFHCKNKQKNVNSLSIHSHSHCDSKWKTLTLCVWQNPFAIVSATVSVVASQFVLAFDFFGAVTLPLPKQFTQQKICIRRQNFKFLSNYINCELASKVSSPLSVRFCRDKMLSVI